MEGFKYWTFFWHLPWWFIAISIILLLGLVAVFIIFMTWFHQSNSLEQLNSSKTKNVDPNTDKEALSDNIKLYKELPNQDNEFTKQFEMLKNNSNRSNFLF